MFVIAIQMPFFLDKSRYSFVCYLNVCYPVVVCCKRNCVGSFVCNRNVYYWDVCYRNVCYHVCSNLEIGGIVYGIQLCYRDKCYPGIELCAVRKLCRFVCVLSVVLLLVYFADLCVCYRYVCYRDVYYRNVCYADLCYANVCYWNCAFSKRISVLDPNVQRTLSNITTICTIGKKRFYRTSTLRTIAMCAIFSKTAFPSLLHVRGTVRFQEKRAFYT